MQRVLIKRGTFQQLLDAQSAGQLRNGEMYLIDGKQVYTGTGPSSYVEGVDTDSQQSLSNKSLIDPSVRTRLTFYAEASLGVIGGTMPINFATFQKARGILVSNGSFNFSFPGVGNYQLILQQDVNGGRTVALNGVSYWVGATSQPAINAAPNGRTLVSLYYDGAAITCGVAKLNAV